MTRLKIRRKKVSLSSAQPEKRKEKKEKKLPLDFYHMIISQTFQARSISFVVCNALRYIIHT